MGDAATVGLVPAADVVRLMPALAQENVTAEVVYKGPVEAPITKGQQIAELVLHVPSMAEARIPLVAEADVPTGGFITKLSTAAQVLFRRVMPAETPAS